MKKYIVYQHKNKITNKSYIGITSQEPEQRWKNGNGYINHPKFYPAIQKYGWNSFEHIILLTNLTKEQACEKEKYFIKIFNSYNNGYNASEGGESGSNGCNKKLQNRKKISQGMKLYLNNNPDILQKRIKQIKNINQENRINKLKEYYNQLTPEQRKNRMKKNNKKIICKENGNIFNSINEAAQWCGIHNSSISHCLRGNQKTAGGYHWEYYNF